MKVHLSLCLLGSLLFIACSPHASESTSEPAPLPANLPEGTVLLVEDRPITAAEVDFWLDHYRLIEPAKSDHHLRRLIITNFALQREVGAILAGAEDQNSDRQLAKREAMQVKEILSNGRELPPDILPATRFHNNWDSEVGIDGWAIGRQTPEGEWSEPFEGIGSFRIVKRVASPDPAGWVGNTEATFEIHTFYYLPIQEIKPSIEAALRQVDIRVVDPEWERYLPVHYLHLDPPE